MSTSFEDNWSLTTNECQSRRLAVRELTDRRENRVETWKWEKDKIGERECAKK